MPLGTRNLKRKMMVQVLKVEKRRRRHGILDKQPDQPAPGTSGEANPDGRGQEVLPDLPPQPVNPEMYTNSTLKYFLLTSYHN